MRGSCIGRRIVPLKKRCSPFPKTTENWNMAGRSHLLRSTDPNNRARVLKPIVQAVGC